MSLVVSLNFLLSRPEFFHDPCHDPMHPCSLLLPSTLLLIAFNRALIDLHAHQRQHFFRWMIATLVDFYINVIILVSWISYRESSWLAAVLWVLFVVCMGSFATCTYIVIKLYMLSAEESSHDLMYHLLLRHQQKDGVVKKSSFQLTSARVIFSLLGCVMLGVLVFTTLNYGSPFHKEIFTPWMNATIIDFYINVTALSVWIGYKESTWFAAFAWIVLLICCGSAASCVYVVWQLLLLSPHDPLYLVLLNNGHRAGSRYERPTAGLNRG